MTHTHTHTHTHVRMMTTICLGGQRPYASGGHNYISMVYIIHVGTTQLPVYVSQHMYTYNIHTQWSTCGSYTAKYAIYSNCNISMLLTIKFWLLVGYGYLFLCMCLILQEDSFTDGSGQNDQLSPPSRSISESSGSSEEFDPGDPLLPLSGMPYSSPCRLIVVVML